MRTDIGYAQQLVQATHATFEVARRLPQEHEISPSVVVIGVPDKPALLRVVKKLQANAIHHHAFCESDFDMGLSAVATVPLSGEERRPLSNYRLWNEVNNEN